MKKHKLLVEFLNLVLEGSGDFRSKLRAIEQDDEVYEQWLTIDDFKRRLESWNVKYDEFPDIDMWLNKNWMFDDGRKEAHAVLSAAVNHRAKAYWGADDSSGWKDENDAFNALVDVLARKAGWRPSPMGDDVKSKPKVPGPGWSDKPKVSQYDDPSGDWFDDYNF